jgi:hypothetical protein
VPDLSEKPGKSRGKGKKKKGKKKEEEEKGYAAGWRTAKPMLTMPGSGVPPTGVLILVRFFA